MSGRRFKYKNYIISFFYQPLNAMSRLIVKNLPSYVTPAKLREHLEQKKGPGGTLTDVKVSSKPDGTSRRFGFVGYKSDHEALAAQRWFDRTFIDSTRISVNVTEVRTFTYKKKTPNYS
jgi:hypothetical protein